MTSRARTGPTSRPHSCLTVLAAFGVIALLAGPAAAQTVTQRGFVEVRGVFFPQDTSNDAQHLVGDLRHRTEDDDGRLRKLGLNSLADIAT